MGGIGLDYMTMGLEKRNDPLSHTGAGRLLNYVKLLDEQPAPHRAQLLSILAESIAVSIDDIPIMTKDHGGNWKKHLELSTAVAEEFIKNPGLAELPCAISLRENLIAAMIKYHPAKKPSKPSYYLPSWNSPKCEAGSGCAVCGVVNQFLRSDTEHVIQLEVSPEEAPHYRDLEYELSGYNGGVSSRQYEYRKDLIIRYFGSYVGRTGNFMVEKAAYSKYKKNRSQYDFQVRERKIQFTLLNEPVDEVGRIRRELAEGDFVEEDNDKPTETVEEEDEDEFRVTPMGFGPSGRMGFGPAGPVGFEVDSESEDSDDSEDDEPEDDEMDDARPSYFWY
ncbi:hypothetical protein ABW20_dc0110058 [Dactylellina cionopaga]|nr:hypothetical protein ABW20_dc0110058 [Dactylellina cionopaga]